MFALLSVWTGLLSFMLAILMVIHRPWFTDVWLTVTLYVAIFSMTFAGMTLWSLRKEPKEGAGVLARRTQCKVGTALSIVAILIVYALVDRLAAHR